MYFTNYFLKPGHFFLWRKLSCCSPQIHLSNFKHPLLQQQRNKMKMMGTTFHACFIRGKKDSEKWATRLMALENMTISHIIYFELPHNFSSCFELSWYPFVTIKTTKLLNLWIHISSCIGINLHNWNKYCKLSTSPNMNYCNVNS